MKRLLITLVVLLSAVTAYYVWAFSEKHPSPAESKFVSVGSSPENITPDRKFVSFGGLDLLLREIKPDPDQIILGQSYTVSIEVLGKTPKIEGVEFSLRENKLDLPDLINVGPAITVPLFLPSTTPEVQGHWSLKSNMKTCLKETETCRTSGHMVPGK